MRGANACQICMRSACQRSLRSAESSSSDPPLHCMMPRLHWPANYYTPHVEKNDKRVAALQFISHLSLYFSRANLKCIFVFCKRRCVFNAVAMLLWRYSFYRWCWCYALAVAVVMTWPVFVYCSPRECPRMWSSGGVSHAFVLAMPWCSM